MNRGQLVGGSINGLINRGSPPIEWCCSCQDGEDGHRLDEIRDGRFACFLTCSLCGLGGFDDALATALQRGECEELCKVSIGCQLGPMPAFDGQCGGSKQPSSATAVPLFFAAGVCFFFPSFCA